MMVKGSHVAEGNVCIGEKNESKCPQIWEGRDWALSLPSPHPPGIMKVPLQEIHRIGEQIPRGKEKETGDLLKGKGMAH